MLARDDNDRVTGVGPGTPMGTAMRRYWIPALLAWELPEPDCPPVRVKLLGEELVAFRDTDGRVGLLAERCPHRQASLFLGRNEECGLRCVYHGWKFDVEGQCVDMMNEPEDLAFAHKIRTTAYPTVEMGGLIWAYLGLADLRPPVPRFAWTQAPATHRHVSKVIQQTNWLQGLEGGIDTSHAPILHRVLAADSARPGFKPTDPFVRGKAPIIELDVTDYGYRYAGLRPLEGGETHVRAYHFILPSTRSVRLATAAPRGFSGAAGPSGSRWMIRPRWSTTGSTARPTRSPTRTGSSAGSATARSTSTRPPSARSATARTTTCWIAACRRPRPSPASTASMPRTARSRRAWGPSSTAPASTWAPPTGP